MTKILNLTQHPATPEQIAQGVVEPDYKKTIQELLTFVGMPTSEEVYIRAMEIAKIAHSSGVEAAMIGGAPYLMAPLHEWLTAWNIRPLYAFSERKSVEETQPDGSVKKTAVFVHVGFVGLP